MAAHPYVDEFVYAVSPKSNDGTIEILRHIGREYGKVRLLIDPRYDFDPMDTPAYNRSYQDCIDQAKGDAVWFLHPDMIVTKWSDPPEAAMAWWVKMTSYAKDVNTVITKGRSGKWKNIHRKKFGLTYLGGYGSANEDFYHSDITGKSLKHFGTDFSKYPFIVRDSGIEVDHYCEAKPYQRRLEKMKRCLKTQGIPEELAEQHPRVTLEDSTRAFGEFGFGPRTTQIPDVFVKYREEFEPFQKEVALV